MNDPRVARAQPWLELANAFSVMGQEFSHSHYGEVITDFIDIKTMDIQLKDLSQGPVYAQVREQIVGQINDKAVSPGETLPSPAALAQKLSVDKGEIQRAYFELERSGLVKKETGKDFLGHSKTTYRVV